MTRNIVDILRGVQPRIRSDAMSETAAFPEWVLVAGMVVAAALAAGAVLGRTVRGRAWAMLGALVLTPVLLVGGDLELAADRVGARAGRAGRRRGRGRRSPRWAALAWLFARRPGFLGVLALAALPFRVPVQAGGSTANLLVPLYVVIGAGALAWLVPRLTARYAGRRPRSARARWSGCCWAAIVLYARAGRLRRRQREGVRAGRVLLRAVRAAVRAAARAGVDAAAAGLGRRRARRRWRSSFTAIGFWEFETRHLLLNPKVIASNQVEEYFRVNSLFFDPNIYGRFLALVMIGLASVLLWAAPARRWRWRSRALVVLWGGLLTTLSQSSFAALLLGLAVLAWLRYGGKVVIVAGARRGRRGGGARLRLPERAAAGHRRVGRSTTRRRGGWS